MGGVEMFIRKMLIWSTLFLAVMGGLAMAGDPPSYTELSYTPEYGSMNLSNAMGSDTLYCHEREGQWGTDIDLYAVVAVGTDGTVKWRYEYEDEDQIWMKSVGYGGHPLLDQHTLIGLDVPEAEKHVWSRSKTDGSIQWSYDGVDLGGSRYAIAANGTIYAVADEICWDGNPTPAGELHAISATGQLLWKYQWTPPAGCESGFGAQLAVGQDGTLYGHSRNGVVYAWDPNTGQVNWELEIDQPRSSIGIAVGPSGKIYTLTFNTDLGYQSDFKCVAINPDGTQAWECSIAGTYGPTMLIVGPDNTVYVSVNQYGVMAIRGGEIVWEKYLGAVSPNFLTLSSNGTLFMHYDSSLYALNTSTRELKWTFPNVTTIILAENGDIYTQQRGYGIDSKIIAIHAACGGPADGWPMFGCDTQRTYRASGGGGGGDGTPEVSIAATTASAMEDGTAVFTVSLDGAASSLLSIPYEVTGTATSGEDYEALSGTVTVPSGTTSAEIPVTGIDDESTEGNETVIVTLSSGDGYTLSSTASATVTFADDESLPLQVHSGMVAASGRGWGGGFRIVNRSSGALTLAFQAQNVSLVNGSVYDPGERTALAAYDTAIPAKKSAYLSADEIFQTCGLPTSATGNIILYASSTDVVIAQTSTTPYGHTITPLTPTCFTNGSSLEVHAPMVAGSGYAWGGGFRIVNNGTSAVTLAFQAQQVHLANGNVVNTGGLSSRQTYSTTVPSQKSMYVSADAIFTLCGFGTHATGNVIVHANSTNVVVNQTSTTPSGHTVIPLTETTF